MRSTLVLLSAVSLFALASCSAAGGKKKSDAAGADGNFDPNGFGGGDSTTVVGQDTAVDPALDTVTPADGTGEDQPDTTVAPPDAVVGSGIAVSEDPGTTLPPVDTDGDSVFDGEDNCVAEQNADQANLDGDSFGDECDPDIDGDDIGNLLDCAPYDAAIAPGTVEQCNGIDDNCDGDTDGPDSKGCTLYFTDGDLDGSGTKSTGQCLCGKGPTGAAAFSGDCDDGNSALGTFSTEKCNGVDDNCNFLVDDGCDDDKDGYCDAGLVTEGTPTVCPNGGGDCLDFSAAVHPGATEVEKDNLDNDCDGVKAGEGGGPIVPDCSGKICTGATAEAMLCAMEICYDGLVGPASAKAPGGDSINGAWAAIAHFGNAGNDLTPFAGNSYAAISSGTFGATSASPETGVSLGGGTEVTDPYSLKDTYTAMNDIVEFTVKLTAPPGASGLAIDYIFMSAEYEEYIGTQFNDKFYILLKSPSTGNQTKVINFTKCSDPGSYFDYEDAGQQYCYIAINTAFSEPCPFIGSAPTSIAGTGYQCSTGSSTGWLTTQWPITGGETFDLTFHIHDTSDESWDSLVIMDNFRWLGGTFTQGTASHN